MDSTNPLTSDSTTTVIARCLCSSFNLTITYPNSSLPIPRTLCLCNSCRKVSGCCANSFIDLPSDITPVITSLTAYKSSEELTRYHCTTCGCQILCLTEDEEWKISSAILDRTEGIVSWEGHFFIGDTYDGGLSDWIPEITKNDGTKHTMSRWKWWPRQSEQLDPGWQDPEWQQRMAQMPYSPDELLEASCHCGGVQFHITRPTAASKGSTSWFPDLMVPFHTGNPENPKGVSWWLCDEDTKYLAGTCACTSCRLTSGAEIQVWAFVPQANIRKTDGQPLDFDFGTLKLYKTPEGRLREFCSKCGATVFWHSEGRSDLIDVSVGLLDPEQGARVERWLHWWTSRVSFHELAVSKSLINGLAEGLKGWQTG